MSNSLVEAFKASNLDRRELSKKDPFGYKKNFDVRFHQTDNKRIKEIVVNEWIIGYLQSEPSINGYVMTLEHEDPELCVCELFHKCNYYWAKVRVDKHINILVLRTQQMLKHALMTNAYKGTGGGKSNLLDDWSVKAPKKVLALRNKRVSKAQKKVVPLSFEDFA